MRFIIIILFITHINIGFTQELIPNGSFEEYNNLPAIYGCFGPLYINNWYSASGTSPDYFHFYGANEAQLPFSYVAEVNPVSGNAIVGICNTSEFNWHEYFQIKLQSPTELGVAYNVSFNLTNGNNSIAGSACNNIGVLLSVDSFYHGGSSPILDRIPQINIEEVIYSKTWINYSFEIIADSNYTALTIGNFYHDSLTTKILMDPTVGNEDKHTCYYFFDDIKLEKIIPPELKSVVEIPNIFTPNSDGSNDVFTPVEINNIDKISCSVLNRWGNVVYKSNDLNFGWDGKDQNGNPVSEGVYFWKIVYSGEDNIEKTMNGTVDLYR